MTELYGQSVPGYTPAKTETTDMDDFEKAIREAQARPIVTGLADFRKAQPRDANGRWTNGSAHGARIDLIDNKDGSRTMYAGGKKETRGSVADVESHMANHGPKGSQATITTPKTSAPAASAPKTPTKTTGKVSPDTPAKDFKEAHAQMGELGYSGSGSVTHSWGGPHSTYTAPKGTNPKRTGKIEVHHKNHADSGVMEFRAQVTVQHHSVSSIRDTFTATFPSAGAAARAIRSALNGKSTKTGGTSDLRELVARG